MGVCRLPTTDVHLECIEARQYRRVVLRFFVVITHQPKIDQPKIDK
jgi:hypothetical protein